MSKYEIFLRLEKGDLKISLTRKLGDSYRFRIDNGQGSIISTVVSAGAVHKLAFALQRREVRINFVQGSMVLKHSPRSHSFVCSFETDRCLVPIIVNVPEDLIASFCKILEDIYGEYKPGMEIVDLSR